MNKIILVIIAVFSVSIAKSQVKDISFTLSPAAEYTWWDSKAGFNDGALVGGKLGFGFGEYLELRGTYVQSLNLKTNFENFGLTNYDANLFTQQDAKLTRWGGEFKANIGTKRLMPYLTLGTGVQKIEVNTNNLEQIYGSVGLGFKFKIGNRAVLAVEGKNTTYNFNSGSNLLTDSNKTVFGVSDADFLNERLSNWSVLGSLQFYLGGRRPGILSELDTAYLNKFKGGFKGLQLVVEPSVAHISFDEKSLLKDSYFLGGYAGLDFNEYIGIRGFYFKGTENDDISTNFDELAMYGIEFRARLNDGNGVTPYLILGGGYLNPSNTYLGKGDLTVKGGEFANGGLGLNIPLGKRVLISGGLRALVTSGEDITNISAPNEIQTHIMYNAGVKFTIGKKSKSPHDVYNRNLESELKTQSESNEVKIENLKAGYESKLATLDDDIKKANEEKDVNKAIELLEEKKEVQNALSEVNKVSAIQVEKSSKNIPAKQETIIQMTPAEFESLIDRILKGLDSNPEVKIQNEDELGNKAIDSLNKRVEMLEKMVLESKKAIDKDVKNPSEESTIDKKDVKIVEPKEVEKHEKENEKILKSEIELKKLNDEIERNSREIKNQQKELKRIKKASAKIDKNEAVISSKLIEENKPIYTVDTTLVGGNENVLEAEHKQENTLKYEHSNVAIGYDFNTTGFVNFGIRSQFNIAKTNLKFVPEAFVGLGVNSYYGVSGNIVYSINLKNQKVKPYIGLGAGALNNSNNFKGFYNAILGANLPIINENIFVDYIMRNTFDYNQISIGYKLPF
tara:strand:- start:14123 stop:16501 length:2379 start_codon:yes stop_codon:yes gene_type:complete